MHHLCIAWRAWSALPFSRHMTPVHGRDGESNNLSWNCGEEGETSDQAVLRLRTRQARNMAVALLLAHGVPMVLMGDEYGHSKASSCCPFRRLCFFQDRRPMMQC